MKKSLVLSALVFALLGGIMAWTRPHKMQIRFVVSISTGTSFLIPGRDRWTIRRNAGIHVSHEREMGICRGPRSPRDRQ